MNTTVTILLAGLATYLLRMSLVATDRLLIGDRQRRHGELVAPATLGALAATSCATAVLEGGLLGGASMLVAAAVAFAAASRTGFSLASVLAGMPAFWLTDLLLS